MVRKYNPEAHLEFPDYCEEYNTPYAVAEMQESRYGEWVELSTYLNEQKRLGKQIEKLKRKVEALESSTNNHKSDTN